MEEVRQATAYLGLGSNLGDRLENLRRAISLLAQNNTLAAVSSVYETAPWGLLEQPAFLNAACQVQTAFSPLELLHEAQRIEGALGRQRAQHWGPRTIDLDILFYEDWVVETADLVVPHPLMHERAFVLMPLAEIAPTMRHPRLEKTVAELLAAVAGREGVLWWGPPASLF